MPPLLTNITDIRAYFLNVMMPVRGDEAMRLFRLLNRPLMGRDHHG